MGISLTPITTQSTINLSDINIDTDLDMGAHSIIGYSTTTSMLTYMPNAMANSTMNSNLFRVINPTTPTFTLTDLQEYTTSATSPTIKSTFAKSSIAEIENNTYYLVSFTADLKDANGIGYAYASIYDEANKILLSDLCELGTSYITKNGKHIIKITSIADNFYFKLWDTYSGSTACIKNATANFYKAELIKAIF